MAGLRVALLHIAPRPGDFQYNCKLVENGIISAAVHGAQWIVTPELCLSGYEFSPVCGTAWIETAPDRHSERFFHLARRLGVTLFLSHAEKDAETKKLHNATFVIGDKGRLRGTHRKIVVIPGIEEWAAPGELVEPISVPSRKVGVLICADAYTPSIAGQLKDKGAQILISPASWTPMPHGPEKSWEDRSRETGLPLFVCNRTGSDHSMNFADAESVVSCGGKRLMTFQSATSSVVLVDWDFTNQSMIQHESRELVWAD